MGVILEKLFGRQQRSWSLRKPVRDWGDPWDDYGREVAGVTVTDRKVVGFPPIWRGLNIICGAVAKLKPEIHDSASREVDRAHAIRRMLRTRPNPSMSGYTWRHTSTFHLIFYGNAYSKIERDPRTNTPTALTLLDPSETVPFFTSDGELVYRTLVDGKQEFVHPEDMHHVKGLSIDGVVGLCMVELMAPYLGGHLAAIEWFNKYFENGTSASGVLMMPGHMRKEAMANAIKYWNEMAQGVAKRGKVAVLQDNVKYQPLTDNAEHAQLLPVMEFGLLDAALMIGIPPHMVGSDRSTSHNSLEEEKESFLDYSLDDKLGNFEEEHNEKLLSDDEQETRYIEYNRDAIVRASKEKRNTSYDTARKGGWITRNDICRAENLPLLPPAIGDTYIVPTNTIEVDKDGNVVVGTPNTKPEGDPAPQNDDDNPPPADAPPQRSSEENADPKQTLNGAQITSLLEIIGQIVGGVISKETGTQLILAAFPFDEARVAELLADVEPAAEKPPPKNPPPIAPPPGDETDDDPDEEPPPDDTPARQLQRAMLVEILAERLDRLRKIEIAKVRKLVGRGEKGFKEAVGLHYADMWKLGSLCFAEVTGVSRQNVTFTDPMYRFFTARADAIFAAAARTDGAFATNIEAILTQFEAENLTETVENLLTEGQT